MSTKYYYRPCSEGATMETDVTIPFRGREIPAGALMGFSDGQTPKGENFARVTRKKIESLFGSWMANALTYTIQMEGKVSFGSFNDSDEVEYPTGILVRPRRAVSAR